MLDDYLWLRIISVGEKQNIFFTLSMYPDFTEYSSCELVGGRREQSAKFIVGEVKQNYLYHCG